MREQSIDEFESIFEQASIPVLDIENVALARIDVVLKGELLDTTILNLARYFKKRFGSTITIRYPGTVNAGALQVAVREHGIDAERVAFASTAELVGQVSIARSQMVLLSEPSLEANRVVDLDALVQGTKPPVLLVREPVDVPATVFGNILHSLTGNFRQTQNFSYSFTLAEKGASLVLLHTIAQSELDDVRGALSVSVEVAGAERDELLGRMAHRGERYLKAVVAASQDRPFDVSYRLAIGEIVPTVRAALNVGEFGLLVVGVHVEGHSHVSAADYQLMRQVRDIPVLAL